MESELNDLLKLIYGKDVVDTAYASPAGRLTKADAKTALLKLLDRETKKARHDEVQAALLNTDDRRKYYLELRQHQLRVQLGLTKIALLTKKGKDV